MQSADSRRRINNITSSLEFFSGQNVLNMEELMLAAYLHYINFASNQPEMMVTPNRHGAVQNDGANVYSRISPPMGSMLYHNISMPPYVDTSIMPMEGTPHNTVWMQDTLSMHAFLQSLNQIWNTAVGSFFDTPDEGRKKQTEELLPEAVQANSEVPYAGDAVASQVAASSENEPLSSTNQADETKLKLTYSQVVRNLSQSHPVKHASPKTHVPIAAQCHVEGRMPKPSQKANRNVNKASRSTSLAVPTSKSRQRSVGKSAEVGPQRGADRQQHGGDKPKQRQATPKKEPNIGKHSHSLPRNQVQSNENALKTSAKKRDNNKNTAASLCVVASKEESTKSALCTKISRESKHEAKKRDPCLNQSVIRQSPNKKRNARKSQTRRRNNKKRRRVRQRGRKQRSSCLVVNFMRWLFQGIFNSGMSAVDSLTGLLMLCMNVVIRFFNLR